MTAGCEDRKIVVKDKVQGRLKPFPLSDVRLQGGLFKRAMEANAAWLLSLEPDRLLSRFREYAGLEPKGEIYGGWESGGLSGHQLGHHLTACALMVQASGDQRFMDRLNYIVDELDVCQQAHGNGFISGVHDCNRIFGELAQGIVRSAGFDLNGGWAPWYTQHKLFAWLRDAYLLCDNAMLDPLMRGEDCLTGLHGNTQITKLIGLERQYELTGEEHLHQAAKFFWETVVRERSYVIGGNTDGKDVLGYPLRRDFRRRLCEVTT